MAIPLRIESRDYGIPVRNDRWSQRRDVPDPAEAAALLFDQQPEVNRLEKDVFELLAT